jgi:hypothetical protein
MNNLKTRSVTVSDMPFDTARQPSLVTPKFVIHPIPIIFAV